MLTNRARQILLLLITSNSEEITINKLANKFKISERSVRNDLEIIDEFLYDLGLGKVEREKKTIISMPNDIYVKGIDKKQLIDQVNTSYSYLTARERQEFIYIETLLAPEILIIDNFAELLGVSRSTVVSDINQLKDFLYTINIYFNYNVKYGYYFKGDEDTIRKYGLKLLNQNAHLRYFVDESIKNGRYETLSDDHIDYLEDIIHIIEKERGTAFSGNAFTLVFLGIIITILRRKKKNGVVNANSKINCSDDEEYSILKKYINVIEEKFRITIKKSDVYFLSNLIREGSLIDSNTYLDKNWLDLFFFVNNFIDEVSNKVGVQLNQDKDLFKALILHLGPAVNRMKNEIHLKNEIIDYIEETYPDIFSMIKVTLNQVSQSIGVTFNTDEIGFITLHVASALEKISSYHRMNIVIVCNHGIGTSRLLKNRIENYLSFNVIKTIKSRELTDDFLIKNKIDLIISTVPLEEKKIPVKIVSPLLTDEELLKLKKTEVNYPILRNEQVKCKIQKGEEPMLEDLLNKDVIDVNVSVDNWEDAVRYGGELLKREGVIESSYIEAMIKTVKDKGPYIVIAPGIALPHASSKDGVNHIGISLYTVKEPVIFGNSDNDPVKIVITLAAENHTNHLNALSELVNILSDNNLKSAIIQANSVKEVRRVMGIN